MKHDRRHSFVYDSIWEAVGIDVDDLVEARVEVQADLDVCNELVYAVGCLERSGFDGDMFDAVQGAIMGKR